MTQDALTDAYLKEIEARLTPTGLRRLKTYRKITDFIMGSAWDMKIDAEEYVDALLKWACAIYIDRVDPDEITAKKYCVELVASCFYDEEENEIAA